MPVIASQNIRLPSAETLLNKNTSLSINELKLNSPLNITQFSPQTLKPEDFKFSQDHGEKPLQDLVKREILSENGESKQKTKTNQILVATQMEDSTNKGTGIIIPQKGGFKSVRRIEKIEEPPLQKKVKPDPLKL